MLPDFCSYLVVVVVFCCRCRCCCAKRGVLSQQYKVEAGQLEVKQNLVKFNNFVREKQGKVD